MDNGVTVLDFCEIQLTYSVASLTQTAVDDDEKNFNKITSYVFS